MEAAIEAVGEFGEVPRKHVRRRVSDARGTRRKLPHPHIRADVYPGDGGAHDFAGRGESNRTRRPLVLGTDANRSMGRPLARRKSIWMAAATRRSWRKRSATAAMSSLLREKDCWTSNPDSLVGRFSAPTKRFAKDTVTPFRESKPQIYLGRSPRESLSARAPTQAVGGAGRRQPCQFAGKIRLPLCAAGRLADCGPSRGRTMECSCGQHRHQRRGAGHRCPATRRPRADRDVDEQGRTAQQHCRHAEQPHHHEPAKMACTTKLDRPTPAMKAANRKLRSTRSGKRSWMRPPDQ